MTKPSRSEIESLVKALALYIGSGKAGSGADIKIQQRLYNAYARKLSSFQSKHGMVDTDDLNRMAESFWNAKLFKGRGSTW